VLFEEAHSFIPEWNFVTPNQRDNVNNTTRMIMQARKYGLRFIIVSQRTAVVSKSGLSQCDNYIVFRTIDHTGLEYIESLAGSAFRDTLSNLRKYEALCMGPALNSDQPVIVELDAPAIAAPQEVAPTVEPHAG
jgi:DNA helicase HerA-like ATPase